MGQRKFEEYGSCGKEKKKKKTCFPLQAAVCKPIMGGNFKSNLKCWLAHYMPVCRSVDL